MLVCTSTGHGPLMLQAHRKPAITKISRDSGKPSLLPVVVRSSGYYMLERSDAAYLASCVHICEAGVLQHPGQYDGRGHACLVRLEPPAIRVYNDAIEGLISAYPASAPLRACVSKSNKSPTQSHIRYEIGASGIASAVLCWGGPKAAIRHFSLTAPSCSMAAPFQP